MSFTKEEFEKAVNEYERNIPEDWDVEMVALWGFLLGLERGSIVANHYMAEQNDPAKAVAASDIKILIRSIAKEFEEKP